MKLLAFNIQNYRSIIHSGWNNLAYDNITALIGQNESGKTSVLEALQSFFDGKVHEDVLRSDLSLPVVHCKFDLSRGSISDLLDNKRIPQPILQLFINKKEISLTRKWKEDRKSIVFISDEDILSYFELKELEKAKIEEKTQEEINNLLAIADSVIGGMEKAEREKAETQQDLSEKHRYLDGCRKTLKRSKKQDLKLIAEKELEAAQSEYVKSEKNFHHAAEGYETAKKKTQELSERVAICKACNESANLLFNLSTDLEVMRSKYKETENQFEISTSTKGQRIAFQKQEKERVDMNKLQAKYEKINRDASIQKVIAEKVLAGENYNRAEAEAIKQIDREEKEYSIYEMGEILFKTIPEFEFFEDFSSLLPNKIDLEDILNENYRAEGYKAARNFLEVAGLDAAFFREKNHRILKQKIENLNCEITINFQDYWSQNVGKSDKIRLNFELEHYDYTHPEKSGKPYLEFWIKDKQERLYPNQRSRGVRWFLSFYLELKATAKKNHDERVLLIDEPGLSLHAKAQEDVLKVFEDLKDKMQVIYCTHSPHLIDLNKLYRILAVQRLDEDDDRSESIILDANSLYSASSDTLSPVYSLMGIKINSQNFIHPDNNIIIEDTISYYYLNAFYSLSGEKPLPAFLPSTGHTNIPLLTNILLGWKVGFSILLMGKSRSDQLRTELEKSVFFSDQVDKEKKIVLVDKFEYPEDIFSTLDFKKFVLQKREGITDKNSDYILENGLSRTLLASQFLNYCEAKRISFKDFDEDTRKNIIYMINKIKAAIT